MPTVTELVVERLKLFGKKVVKTVHGHARSGANPQPALEALEAEAIADIKKILSEAGVP